jgi:hypothetical protein
MNPKMRTNSRLSCDAKIINVLAVGRDTSVWKHIADAGTYKQAD